MKLTQPGACSNGWWRRQSSRRRWWARSQQTHGPALGNVVLCQRVLPIATVWNSWKDWHYRDTDYQLTSQSSSHAWQFRSLPTAEGSGLPTWNPFSQKYCFTCTALTSLFTNEANIHFPINNFVLNVNGLFPLTGIIPLSKTKCYHKYLSCAYDLSL